MADHPRSVKSVLTALGLVAVSATPGCFCSVGNPAPDPFDAGSLDSGHDAGAVDSAVQSDAGSDAGAMDSGSDEAGTDDAGSVDDGGDDSGASDADTSDV